MQSLRGDRAAMRMPVPIAEEMRRHQAPRSAKPGSGRNVL